MHAKHAFGEEFMNSFAHAILHADGPSSCMLCPSLEVCILSDFFHWSSPSGVTKLE